MSAFLQDRAHFLAVVRTALDGPADPRTVSPDNVWYGPHWSAVSDAALAEMNWQDAGKTFRRLEHSNAEDVAEMLRDENIASVRYRYGDADEVGMIAEEPAITLHDITRKGRRLSAVDALSAISGLEYQSCEHPEWQESEARRFLEAFRRSLCDFLSRDADCWSIRDDELVR